MQQTETYKLNLIEKDDVFSPDALNQNTQKVENLLKAKADTAETGQQFTDLADRVTALELKKVVVGTYVGNNTNGNWNEIHLGFKPAAILLRFAGGNPSLITSNTESSPLQGSGAFGFTEDGFRVRNGTSYNVNSPNTIYPFVAIV